jgi:hypothetical protein
MAFTGFFICPSLMWRERPFSVHLQVGHFQYPFAKEKYAYNVAILSQHGDYSKTWLIQNSISQNFSKFLNLVLTYVPGKKNSCKFTWLF